MINQPIVITGAAGFIGSALCHRLAEAGVEIHGVDRLSYAANPQTVDELQRLSQFTLHPLDITDPGALAACLATAQPQTIIHLAAETHVDRSIDATAPFMATNVMGTYHVLQATLSYWRRLPQDAQQSFRLLHVSTDEVYGSLGATGRFTPDSPHAPNSPYAASKAAAEGCVRAWHRTFGLPVLTVNSCNVFGPRQFPEKLIPTMILKAIHGEVMPLYGTGDNRREWLYVEDMVAGLLCVLRQGIVGCKYHLAADNGISNLDLVQQLCKVLDAAEPDSPHCPHSAFMQFVADRPGHDFRYALDCSATERELGWRPLVMLEEGLRRTVRWYLDHPAWWQQARIVYNGDRLGLGMF